MKALLTRALTGIIFVGLIIFSIVSNPWILFNVFLIITCLALFEYRNLLMTKSIRLSPLFFVPALAVYFMIAYTDLWEIAFFVKLFPFLLLAMLFSYSLFALFRKTQHRALTDIAASLAGIIVIVLPFAFINHFPLLTANGHLVLLAVFVLIWTNDTFAYSIGSLIGKHSLFPRISPKKTWEGSIGGALCTWIFAYFFPFLFPSLMYNSWKWMGLAAVIVLTGTLGDLIESMFKRELGVKDSGTILPGHGGVLDRFDSILFAIPFVFIYLYIIN
ncbi:MAG: phosphatidate cytidylyltransferase [Bacteroidales bacterium]|nr:phosphatidate cytidylyltransferase [Bacteroidales bacterium]MDD4209432.1 phosphatidate cytidylyltransferase [Bacteroidales bacterium]